ncbi:BsaWI family type II restriction enzyme [Segatella copri]|uniref:BsaWI family type II restriction enzyme n=1 Tax=Segatella copri TaxID=165179 RepID=UPI003F8BEAD7
MANDIQLYCEEQYTINYNKCLQEILDGRELEELSETKRSDAVSMAQLKAIKQTMVNGLKQFPNDVALLWQSIYAAYLIYKSGIHDFEMIKKALEAAQSWKASSGHAFESMVAEISSLALSGTNIRYVLQKDLNTLLKAGELANQPTDLEWLKQKVKGSVFDVYVIADINEFDEDTSKVETKTYCFGCVQCKTSIRDRVSRDIVPSKEAMDSSFWSIGFVLDGEMLKNPKYTDMVNGNPETEFKRNGWHGMYVLSYKENCDRIYAVDLDFKIIKEHTLKAYNQWHKDRMGFKQSWRADK